jgi:hypothetical protein
MDGSEQIESHICHNEKITLISELLLKLEDPVLGLAPLEHLVNVGTYVLISRKFKGGDIGDHMTIRICTKQWKFKLHSPKVQS